MNLPECANQQVCSALFVRLNHTRKLCECSREFNWQCNTLSKANDGHTIELSKRSDKKVNLLSLNSLLCVRCNQTICSVFLIKVYTQIKICEKLDTIRPCRRPTDWTLLALQSERTGRDDGQCPTYDVFVLIHNMNFIYEIIHSLHNR